jgi:uncharacterized LabA/DUF88 family protein
MTEQKKFKLKIKKRTLLIVDWSNVYNWKNSLGWEVCPKKIYHFFDRPKIVDKRIYHGLEVGQLKSEQFKFDMENLGYSFVTKEVKFPPVSLDKSHFRQIIKNLFDALDDIKNTNSNLSTKLYELSKKVERLPKISIGKGGIAFNLSNEKELKEIYEMIEDLDADLNGLNLDIGTLQENLKIPVRRRKCDFDVEIARDVLNMTDDYDTLLLFSGDGDYFALTEDLIKKGKKVILVFAEGHKGKEYDTISDSLFFACPVDNLKNFLKK